MIAFCIGNNSLIKLTLQVFLAVYNKPLFSIIKPLLHFFKLLSHADTLFL